MGSRDRDWWKEKYDELHGRNRRSTRKPGDDPTTGPHWSRGLIGILAAIVALVVTRWVRGTWWS